MQTKPSPLAALKALTADQADELYDYLRTSPYYRAVKWVLEQWGVEVSISSLQRWWNRQTKQRSRRNLRTAIQASAQFDKDLDSRALDARATNAIRAAFWQAISCNDLDSIKTLGTLVLDYNSDARGGQELQLKRDTLEMKERKLELDRAKFESAERRLCAASDAAKRVNASGGLTAEGLEEIERALKLI